MDCNMDSYVMKLLSVISESISVGHLSTANLLVIAHIWFSVFLLGCGSPYMGTSFSGTGSMPPPRT